MQKQPLTRKGYAFSAYHGNLIDAITADVTDYSGETQNGHVGNAYVSGMLGGEPAKSLLLPMYTHGVSIADTISGACMAAAIRQAWQVPQNIDLFDYIADYAPETATIADEDTLHDYGDYWDDLRAAVRRYRADCIARSALSRCCLQQPIPEGVDAEAWARVAYQQPDYQAVPFDIMGRLNDIVAATGYGTRNDNYYAEIAREDKQMLQALRNISACADTTRKPCTMCDARLTDVDIADIEDDIDDNNLDVSDAPSLDFEIDIEDEDDKKANKKFVRKPLIRPKIQSTIKPLAKQPIRAALELLRQNWHIVYGIRSTYYILGIIAKISNYKYAEKAELLEMVRETARYWQPM